MIRPEDIARKALNLYPAWQLAWLNGEPFFPRVLPCDKSLDESPAVAAAAVQQLRAGSKEVLGYGYSIEWKERNSRRHGRNRFPERIVFQTEADFLRLINKQREFSSFRRAVQEVRERYPELDDWIRSHRQELVDAAAEFDGLLAVVDYFVAHPRPHRFARELPIPVDTKFIERNQRILRSWLDIVLAPHTIRADETHFDRRFGLRYVEPLILVRFLDPFVQEQSRSPWDECAIPLHTLADSPIACERVLIVENKVNLLTLPPIDGGIAVGGLGNGVMDLRYLTWLAGKELWYWGDIDVEGLEILSRLRSVFPETRSVMMDVATVQHWRGAIGSSGTGRQPLAPPGLTAGEAEVWEVCASDNLRIEQERLPQPFVLGELARVTGCCTLPAGL